MSDPVYRISTNDDVAVAIRDLNRDETVRIGSIDIVVRDPIPRGHKIALRSIEAGEEVHKYGSPIGRATDRIAVGSHIHSHNLATQLTGADSYTYEPGRASSRATATSRSTFMGYRRSDGSVGTRNEIWILCTVGCVAKTAERIARLATQNLAGRVDGVFAFPHQFGCSQLGGDLDRTRKLIAALACHPNAGGALVIGLGCESNQLDMLLTDIPAARRGRVRAFTAQEASDEIDTGLKY